MTERKNIKSKKKLSERVKQYYNDKNMLWRYIVLFVLLVLICIQLLWNKPDLDVWNISFNYKNISFAGEKVDFWDEYFFNKERLDREIAITELNVAQFVMIHKRELQYLPYIEKKLKESNIPTDFKYLPVAESALRNVAYSHAWAAGIRQFMPATAEHYGLIVNDEVDERLYFEKATDAAISYLLDLYDRFGDWTLVAAAYNRWENGLQRDMDRQEVDNYYDLWLNEETSRYIFRIIAIKEIMEHKTDYFSEDILWEQYPIIPTIIIKEKEISDIASRAKEHGTSYNQIRRLNPWIVGNSLEKWRWKISVLKK